MKQGTSKAASPAQEARRCSSGYVSDGSKLCSQETDEDGRPRLAHQEL